MASLGSTSIAFEGGFENAVFDSQTAFRAILDVMSRPGSIASPDVRVAPPAPMNAMAGVVALTLCDPDTPVWLDDMGGEEKAVAGWIGFHGGAPTTQNKSTAAICFLSRPAQLAGISNMALGSQEYPDRSATVVVQVEGFEVSPGWVLSGPGIKKTCAFQPLGVDEWFLQIWEQNLALYPRGVDVIFASEHQIAALPRTTRIQEMAGV